MRAVRCDQHTIQLTLLARLFPINCFLVAEADGLTVVDSTIRSPAADVARLVAEVGLEVRRIALTHAHADHVGGVAALRSRFSDVEIAISRRDARLLEGDKRLDPGEPAAPVKGSFTGTDWKPDRLLEPGDRVGSLEVVAAPGHTPGHLAFLDTRTRLLLAGDALQTRGGLAVAGVVRPLFPFVAFGTWHRPTAVTTAVELRKLRPAKVAVGHGEPLADPGAALDRAIEVARRKSSADAG